MNGAIYPLQYDVLNDFEPVGLLTSNLQMIIGRKSLPTNDLKNSSLGSRPIRTRRRPGPRASVARSTCSVMFQKATNTHFLFSHYRGGVLATQDLVAG